MQREGVSSTEAGLPIGTDMDQDIKIQDIINAIPGGIAIYKVTDIFETVYFSDGVPELSGYTVEEYREQVKCNAAEMTYHEDTAMVVAKAMAVAESCGVDTFEFRKQHRDGHIVWVRVQMKWIGEEDGCPLLHCVFHNISDLKEAQLEMDHLINSIPGGIASYRAEGGRLIPTYFSNGVLALSGHSRQELEGLAGEDALNVVYEADRDRVKTMTRAALLSGEPLDIPYRIRHKNGSLIWVHFNGRRMGPISDSMRFYGTLTGMPAEVQLFQSMANEGTDGIYVIDRQTYDLLYVNESKSIFGVSAREIGQKCYAALYGRSEPCSSCGLRNPAEASREYEVTEERGDRFYKSWFRNEDWNGIPAYIRFAQDVTEKIKSRREIERLEKYFQTLVKHLPGGVAVVRYEKDGTMAPEFFSKGFAELVSMTEDELWKLYRNNAMAGVHPEDKALVQERMDSFSANGETRCEMVYRLKKGDGSYIWVKNNLSMIQSEGGEYRTYASFRDITGEREERERLRQSYNELIMQHYRTPGPDALVVGHCNITQNKIIEIIDHTGSDLLAAFGSGRESFFDSMADLVVDETERRIFRETYLRAPAQAAFQRGITELVQTCFIQLPEEERGRYAQFKVNLVETPDTGDITGILTVTDITEQTISDRILHRLSAVSCDLLVDVDLLRDHYRVLSCDQTQWDVPQPSGCHSERITHLLLRQVVPADRDQAAQMLDPAHMLGRLKQESSYSFHYSIEGENGEIRTKKLTASATDLRLGRVCLARADITDSIREQQSLLNVVADTFELLGIVYVDTGHFTLYHSQTVQDRLSPFTAENYDASVGRLAAFYVLDGGHKAVEHQFRLETMLQRLKEKPDGYDFVLPYRGKGEVRYKQINVMWGDRERKTVCMVRADVTEMLAAERSSQNKLEKALAQAEKANRAKTDFLSSMSHDIRTPMNAIMGMTALAVAHLDDRDRVEECLRKIDLSSQHLLSLINDVLDMNKIELSKITMNRVKISLAELAEQLSAMMRPQANNGGLHLGIQVRQLSHPYCYGDLLRMNQILINLLSNAIKFTPEGGTVRFKVEEIPPRRFPGWARYRFTVSDTGMGIEADFLPHMFEPFSRSRAAAHIEGTGLGLSITKGLVDLMGGELSVESQLHHGSTFRVELECEAARDGGDTGPAQEGGGNSAADAERLAGRFFLVAEDNAINAEILCELLETYGARSAWKTDGEQTVAAFQSADAGTYDAILMDIQMPEMNGYEATRAIRKLERADARSIPIIAMTANAFAEDVQSSLDAGMTAHVAKPIDMRVLLTTLDRLI